MTDWNSLNHRNRTVVAHLQRLHRLSLDRATRRFLSQQRNAYEKADRALGKEISDAVQRDIAEAKEKFAQSPIARTGGVL